MTHPDYVPAFVKVVEGTNQGELMSSLEPGDLAYGETSDPPGPWVLVGMPLDLAEFVLMEQEVGVRKTTRRVMRLLEAALKDRESRLK
jgi:hypothetical protein